MSDVNLGNAQPAPQAKQPTSRRAPRPGICTCGSPEQLGVVHRSDAPCYVVENYHDARADDAEPVDTRERSQMPWDALPSDISGVPVQTQPANPYAPTGWRKRNRVEFDLELPSGQVCRVLRLERDDMLRLNLIQYLDTFTPALLEGSADDAEKQQMMQDELQKNPAGLQKMLQAIDKVVLAAVVKPQITEDPNKVNYGNENDWANPNFVPVALLEDIDTFERMIIFGAAFGRSMDDLKSFLEGQAPGLASLANESGVQQVTE